MTPSPNPASLSLFGQDESGGTAEERQNNQNAGLEGEEARPESRPLLQETQNGMTKASPPLEDEDRGLGDSLPNTTSSSQTSLSALPTATSSGSTPHQSPTAFRLLPADMVREHVRVASDDSLITLPVIPVFLFSPHQASRWCYKHPPPTSFSIKCK